jgi:hypothetical protein
LVVLKEKEVIKEKEEAENGDANPGKANKNGTTNFTRQTLNDLCLKRQWPMPQYRQAFVTLFGPWFLFQSMPVFSAFDNMSKLLHKVLQ